MTDLAREMFPMVWFGFDRPVDQENSLIRDFRPQAVRAPEPEVAEVPKASPATQVADSSSDGSETSQSDAPADPANAGKDQPTPTGSTPSDSALASPTGSAPLLVME